MKQFGRVRTEAQEYIFKILVEIINPFLNMEPKSPSIFTDIIYTRWRRNPCLFDNVRAATDMSHLLLCMNGDYHLYIYYYFKAHLLPRINKQ